MKLTDPAVLLPLVLSFTSVFALTISDWRHQHTLEKTPWLRYIFKPLAASAFLWLAVNVGAMDSNYGQWILAALILCAIGDLCLMFKTDAFFLSGLGAFLTGHLLFAVAFWQLFNGFEPSSYLTFLLFIMPIISLRWLMPNVGNDMKIPVIMYISVITAMLIFAGLTFDTSGGLLRFAGALGFAISDLAVARQQFVKPSPINGLWGTPLYFFSQMLLAYSCVFG